MLLCMTGSTAQLCAEEVTIDFTSVTEIAAMGFTVPEEGKSTQINESFTYKGITITPYAGTQTLSFYNSNGVITLRYYKESGGNKGGLGLSVEGALIMKIVIKGNTQLANSIADNGRIEMTNSNRTLFWTSDKESGVESVTLLNGGTKTATYRDSHHNL